MHLYGFVDGQCGCLGNFGLGHARQCRAICAALVDGLQRFQNGRFAEFEFAKQLCRSMGQRLETTHRHAELLAFLEVTERPFKGLLCDAEQFGCGQCSANIQRTLQHRSRSSQLTQQVTGIDLDGVETEARNQSIVRVECRFDSHSICVAIDKKQAHAMPIIRSRNNNKTLGDAAVENMGFAAVEHKRVAIDYRGHFDLIRRKPASFVDRQRNDFFACGDCGQDSLFLRVAARGSNQRCTNKRRRQQW